METEKNFDSFMVRHKDIVSDEKMNGRLFKDDDDDDDDDYEFYSELGLDLGKTENKPMFVLVYPEKKGGGRYRKRKSKRRKSKRRKSKKKKSKTRRRRR